jgi:uncharacterized repeat protein (TIGR03803 family)
MKRFDATWRGLACFATVWCVGLGLTAASPPARAWDPETLFHFSDEFGFRVPAGVIRKQGALYGVVSNGGTLQCGSVFKLTAGALGDPWNRVILHQFAGGDADGCSPQGELVFGPDGALFGTAYGGGLDDCTTIDGQRCGIVYKLAPAPDPGPWGFQILYKFKGGNDGYYPSARLIFGDDDALYGTTGGYCGNGGATVFKLTPPASGQTKWTHKVIYSAPTPIAAPVVFDETGNLYGTEGAGCTFGRVFKLEKPVPPATKWRARSLHDFTGGADGSFPFAGVIFDAAGILYGTTDGGGGSNNGTVFSLTPPVSGNRWKHKVLHSFAGQPDGAHPDAELVQDSRGVFYSTTVSGGEFNYGTVFQLKQSGADWNASVLLSFTLSGPQGYWPKAPLTLDGRNVIYGTSSLSDAFRLTR